MKRTNKMNKKAKKTSHVKNKSGINVSNGDDNDDDDDHEDDDEEDKITTSSSICSNSHSSRRRRRRTSNGQELGAAAHLTQGQSGFWYTFTMKPATECRFEAPFDIVLYVCWQKTLQTRPDTEPKIITTWMCLALGPCWPKFGCKPAQGDASDAWPLRLPGQRSR